MDFFIAILSSSVFTALLTGFFARRKTKAEAADIVADSAAEFALQVVKENADLRKQLDAAYDQIRGLQFENLELRAKNVPSNSNN